jgi:hypothetical protein
MYSVIPTDSFLNIIELYGGMLTFKTKPRKWGNSLGFTIPREVVDEGRILPDEELEIVIVRRKEVDFQSLFGKYKFKKSTKQIMKEIDEGWDD